MFQIQLQKLVINFVVLKTLNSIKNMSKIYTLVINSNQELHLNTSDVSKADIIKISKEKYHAIHKNKQE